MMDLGPPLPSVLDHRPNQSVCCLPAQGHRYGRCSLTVAQTKMLRVRSRVVGSSIRTRHLPGQKKVFISFPYLPRPLLVTVGEADLDMTRL